MQDKEYESKWQYVMHTENMQAKFIQWYLTVCAAVFVFVYSDKAPKLSPLVSERWLALCILALYSILTCLRLLAQKRNYDTYTKRLRVLEGNDEGDNHTRLKVVSVFKFQYYVICLVGGLVFAALSSELGIRFACSVLVGVVFSISAIVMSFTKLIGD